MDAKNVKTVDDAKQIVNERNLKHVKVGVFDIDGILRGKYMSKAKFFSALDHGFGFCDVILGWDSKDQLYDNVEFTGWHTGYPDAATKIIPESCRDLPFEENGLFFLSAFEGKAKEICPRSLLDRVLTQAADMGCQVQAAFEYEFFVFDETRDSIREKNYQNLKPIAPGYFGYSVLRNSVDSDFYQQLLDLAEDMDFPIEGLHEETGPGVLEAAITVDNAQSAADKAALFKTFSKVIAQRNNKILTFMAKWSPDWPGQSGHIHVSLNDINNNSLFFDASQEYNMSEKMKYFLGGQQQLMPELLAMIAPTINSYTRLVPGFWAPIQASWGVENRTCALRVIPGSAKSQRVEYRIAAADANPYIALSAVIASGLWGIENKILPGEQTKGNAYEQKLPPEAQLPATLWDAAQRLKSSDTAKQLFGEAFVNHYAASREWEEREYRKHISDWELERYFEII
ncbi:glutamine synthetase family protein [hydrothermal vent metagenome]|uniref:Glutamine synthetase family protein n=1 Tax=hydrothermal vent metagenome TaxID=652676 RepID=A0A3B0ZRC4_9ZZZZ